MYSFNDNFPNPEEYTIADICEAYDHNDREEFSRFIYAPMNLTQMESDEERVKSMAQALLNLKRDLIRYGQTIERLRKIANTL